VSAHQPNLDLKTTRSTLTLSPSMQTYATTFYSTHPPPHSPFLDDNLTQNFNP